MQAAVIPIVPEVRLRRLLFATDLSETNCATLPIISTVARRYHSQVLIAHVWSPSSVPMVSRDVSLMIEADEEDKIREEMKRLQSRPELAGLQTEILLQKDAGGTTRVHREGTRC